MLAVNIGTAIFHDRKAHNRWAARRRRTAAAASQGGVLKGASLGRYVRGLKITNPDIVAMPGERVRRMGKGDVRSVQQRATKPRKRAKAAR